MAENGTVWVPTLSTIGNLRGKGRFDETAVEQILESAMENASKFAAMGGLVAEGSDAGQSAAKETSHGEANERHAGLSSKAFFGPVKGTHEKQIYAGIAAPELFSHGKSRKDMPAGATGCQEDSLNHFFAVREKLIMSPVQSMVATRLEPP